MMPFNRGLAAAAVAIFGFAGQALAADPVTLNFWVSWSPEAADAIAAKKEIAAYEQAHPGVKIDVQNITYDALHDKLLTALAGGDAPDLSWGLPEWLGELNKMGALQRPHRGRKDVAGSNRHLSECPRRADHRRPSARHAALSRHSRAAGSSGHAQGGRNC